MPRYGCLWSLITKIITSWLLLLLLLLSLPSAHRFSNASNTRYLQCVAKNSITRGEHRDARCTRCSTFRNSPSRVNTTSSELIRGGGVDLSSRSGSDLVRNKRTTSTTVSFRRRACSLYIWNAPSALLFHWCHHLQKDNIYEGLGGKKFVRIRPGSMLQLLYPCSQYSLDKCLLCGGTFRDHLMLWWSKNLYTPFDRHLDQVYHESMVVPTLVVRKDVLTSAPSTRQSIDHSKSFVNESMQFGYHRRYVIDLTSLFDDIQKPKEKAVALQRMIQHRYDPSIQLVANHMEQRKWPRFANQPNVKYIVPRSGLVVDKRRKSFIVWLARDICLDAIDRLLDLQQIDRKENANNQ